MEQGESLGPRAGDAGLYVFYCMGPCVRATHLQKAPLRVERDALGSRSTLPEESVDVIHHRQPNSIFKKLS